MKETCTKSIIFSVKENSSVIYIYIYVLSIYVQCEFITRLVNQFYIEWASFEHIECTFRYYLRNIRYYIYFRINRISVICVYVDFSSFLRALSLSIIL